MMNTNPVILSVLFFALTASQGFSQPAAERGAAGLPTAPQPPSQGRAIDNKGAPKLMKGGIGKSADEKTYSSLDRPDPADAQELPYDAIKFSEADLSHVLDLYQNLAHRTLIHSTALPDVKISLQNETPLSRHEALQALDSVLAQNGVTMIPMGTKFIKAVPSQQASTEAPPLIDLPANQLPDSSSYMMYIIELKMNRPREVAPALQPFAKMPNSIIAVDSSGIIIIRDYSANIRRMLKVLEKIEVPDAPETPAPDKKP